MSSTFFSLASGAGPASSADASAAIAAANKTHEVNSMRGHVQVSQQTGRQSGGNAARQHSKHRRPLTRARVDEVGRRRGQRQHAPVGGRLAGGRRQTVCNGTTTGEKVQRTDNTNATSENVLLWGKARAGRTGKQNHQTAEWQFADKISRLRPAAVGVPARARR